MESFKNTIIKTNYVCKLSLLIFAIICSLQLQADNNYSFYEENGKWGVHFKGEPCLLPVYDQVANIQQGGLFFYKENEKWGIANLWKRITEPFCDSLLCFNNNVAHDNPNIFTNWRDNSLDVSYLSFNFIQYRFLSNGKWGICSVDGKEIIPPIYDEIDNDFLNFRSFGQTYKEVQKKIPVMLNNKYYLVKLKGTYKMIDICNTTILQDLISIDDFESKEGQKRYNKIVIKNEKGRSKDNTTIIAINSQATYTNEKTCENILFRKFVSSSYNDGVETFEDIDKPREMYFGYKGGQMQTPSGETLVVSGQKSITTKYGFVGIPLVYDSPVFRLQRNPLDILSLADLIDRNKITINHYIYYIDASEVTSGVAERDLILLQSKIKSFAELMEMAENLGDMDSFTEVKKRRDDNQERYNNYKKNFDRAVSTMNFNAKVDRIAGAATSFLNSMINSMGGSSSSSSATFSSSTGASNGGKTTKNSTSSSMSMSDQVNYNSLRNTYNKWAMDLMQMKSLSGKYQNGYKSNDKQHAQSEMKRIRKDAMNKWGKEIPYNSIEDWRNQ